ncbi:response regulator transcription factor [Phaeovibrio sulfidiphilus]|uniref:Response regulator transcription factor n=1 Tax=Phaeovibrio sulfidiphilus TaxID=1220600 RepID=A0A8J6YQV3_9PROT|nr:response regulator transcription factor [Phaeovibrio sulfidiphilus]MBE1237702.1 response regulator transcription factor [Phaeovibrio sulfidiphilus]
MRLLIVDDHELFRNGLRFQISAIDPTIEIVEASTFSRALRMVEGGSEFDVVFLDIMIPDSVDWKEALVTLRSQDNPPDAVVMSGREEPRIISSAIELGAVAFIPKSLEGDVLESALRLVLVGGFTIAPRSLQRSLAAATQEGARVARRFEYEDGDGDVEEDPFSLTPRQREVLEHINSGLSNRRIAEEMNLSEATIKMHIGRLFKVLGAQSRTDALALARRKRIL